MMDGPGGARDPRFGNPYGMGLEAPADMYGGGALRAGGAGSLQACSGLPRGLKRPGSEACYDERPVPSQGHGLEHCPMPDIADDGYASLQPKKSPPSNGKKTKGRVKIKMEYIDNKLRRYTTFSKRKTGIMKKAYELSTLTGTQVMLLVASETGHVYTFATRKLQPMITSDSGKRLIQTCLNSPDPPSGAPVGDQRMSATGFEETELTYNIVDDDIKTIGNTDKTTIKQQVRNEEPTCCMTRRKDRAKAERSPMSSGDSCDESGSEPESPSDKYPPRAAAAAAGASHHRAPADWNKTSSPEPEDYKREQTVATSATHGDSTQAQVFNHQRKDLKAAHGLPAGLAGMVPSLGMPGAYCHPMSGLEGLGSNLGLPMGYPHGIILGLANQGSDGAASTSQPQFITIPLSMAMAAAAATVTQATAGGGGSGGCGGGSAGADELQDLSTGARK